jgi:hypothetical protein
MSIYSVRVAGTWKPLGVPTFTGGTIPDASTTGYVAWPGYTGSLTTSTKDSYSVADSGVPGTPQVYSGLRMGTGVGSVRVTATAHDIVFRGCEVIGWATDLGGFHVEEGANNITFEYCTIHAAAPTDNTLNSYNNVRMQYGIYSNATNTTVNRCNLYWGPDLLQVNNTGTVITNNYVHDMTFWSDTNGPGGFTGDHVDCLQMNAGTDNVLIKNNNFECIRHDGTYMDQTSALALFQDFSPSIGYTNVQVDGNLLAGPVGGGAWTYCGYETSKGGAPGTGVVYSNNLFSYKPFSSGGAPGSGFVLHSANQPWNTNGNIWTNNTWYDGPNAGQIVPE